MKAEVIRSSKRKGGGPQRQRGGDEEGDEVLLQTLFSIRFLPSFLSCLRALSRCLPLSFATAHQQLAPVPPSLRPPARLKRFSLRGCRDSPRSLALHQQSSPQGNERTDKLAIRCPICARESELGYECREGG